MIFQKSVIIIIILYCLLTCSFFQITEFCEEIYNAGSRSPYLIAFLIDLYIEKAVQIAVLGNGENGHTNNSDQNTNENIYAVKVLELCNIMALKHDIIRAKYWKYVADNFEKRMQTV